MKSRPSVLLSIAIAALLASVALAASRAVTDRQASMKDMAAAVKAIDAIFRGQTTYSSQALKTAAETISRNAGAVLIGRFIDQADGEGTHASADIWSDREHFDQLAVDLKGYADLIAVAADQNPQSMSPSMRMKPGESMGGGPFGVHVEDKSKLASLPAEHAFHLMIQTCTTCHVRYRTPG